jgi:hypothetical protein
MSRARRLLATQRPVATVGALLRAPLVQVPAYAVFVESSCDARGPCQGGKGEGRRPR